MVPGIVLTLLCVLPAFQRQGLGALLIKDGLGLVDREGARTYIEASPAGLELYKRFGWKHVDDAYVDRAEYGGEGVAISRMMIREPQTECVM